MTTRGFRLFQKDPREGEWRLKLRLFFVKFVDHVKLKVATRAQTSCLPEFILKRADLVRALPISRVALISSHC